MKVETKSEYRIEVQEEEDEDFLSQVAAAEAHALSISSAKRRKVDPEGAYTAALKGLAAPVDSRQAVASRNADVYGSSSCFKCGKSGHWARDCDAKVAVGGGGGCNSNFGSNSSIPEKQCPCGNGPCLVLTANTQKKSGQKVLQMPSQTGKWGLWFL